MCALDASPGPVNAADIAELTDVIEDRLSSIEYLLWRHLPLRKRLVWKLTEYVSSRFGR